MGVVLAIIFWIFVTIGVFMLVMVILSLIWALFKCALFILVYPIVWLTRDDTPSSTTSHKCDNRSNNRDWL